MNEPTQKELEQTAKVYQLRELTRVVESMAKDVADIKNQTRGVVTYDQMIQYVDKRIDEKTKSLWDFKSSTNKIGFMLISAIIVDIFTRIYK